MKTMLKTCIVQKRRKCYRMFLIVGLLTACSVITIIYRCFILDLDVLFSSPMTEDDLCSLNLTLRTLLSEHDRQNITYFMTHGTLLERYADVTVIKRVGSRPSDHYFRSVCLFVCAEFFSAVFNPISIKLGHMLYVWV